jgi:p-hydroxybenzoate 3-monooxygenase
MRTQVAIVGAGPAGLVLSHLLAREGIESVVLESRSREYVERRVRAGLLEQGSVDLLKSTGVGDRLQRESLTHQGLELAFDGERHRIPLTELTGRTVTIYGQQEVVKDLIKARLESGGTVLFEAQVEQLAGLETDHPTVTYRQGGELHTLEADVIAGCDGFHGVSREAIPTSAYRAYDTSYPFAWLGILAAVPPSGEELIYVHSPRGFALHTMRSPTITRLYLQVATDDDLANWSDERIWEELSARLSLPGFNLTDGPILEKGITAMRSFVMEPMQYGRLYMAGDAAHIVPPTGAKGMNLAIADVKVLAAALTAWYQTGQTDLLEAYSATCLRRVWRAQHFSWWMTSMLHHWGDEDGGFQQRLQLSQLRYVVSSRAAATSLAENYVGLEQV